MYANNEQGISRYCIKVPSYDEAVIGVKKRRNKIYVEQQKGKRGENDELGEAGKTNQV